jgi:hypothetical protein
MHWRLRSGGERRWHVEHDGILYVNTARVPRVFRAGQARVRHHLALELAEGGASVREVLVADEPPA